MLSKTGRQVLERWVVDNPYIPHVPFRQQARFLALPDREALYGGAAGGGKSDALLMAALMFVEIPGYNAILFRKTYADLALPEAIMMRSHQWLQPTDASWNGSDYRWTFPSGATLSFGYLNHDKDRYRYQSAAFQFIGFDELTQFPSDHYLYLFSRLRRLEGETVGVVPLRMRGGTNPGGIGHHWVYERFVVDAERPFISSRLEDNPHIDQDSYRENLRELDETTRRQLEGGEWVLDPGGKPFNREWYRGVNRYLGRQHGAKEPDPFQRWISLDTALETRQANDYTAWCVAELTADYHLRIREVGQERLTFPELLDLIKDLHLTWNRDKRLSGILIEGAASGKPAVQSLRAAADKALASQIVEVTPKGSKVERATRAALWAKRGFVQLPVPGNPWLASFERELFTFPDVEHDDRVDALTQLVIYLENYLAAGWGGYRLRRKARRGESRIERAYREEGLDR